MKLLDLLLSPAAILVVLIFVPFIRSTES